MKICLVDDDKKLITLLKRFFTKNGYDNVDDMEPQDILNQKKLDHDLFILDIMMPDIDGFEVCREIRRKSEAFVIFLSAKQEALDRIIGLELGADDYMTKPFEPRELLARIQALFRRREKDRTKAGDALGKIPLNCPRGVRAELEAACVVELVHRSNERHVSVTDELKQLIGTTHMTLRHGND